MPVSPDYLDRFLQELEAVRVAVELSSKAVPSQLAALNKQLSHTFDVYQGSGPSRGKAGVPYQLDSGYSSLNGLDAAAARGQLARGDVNEAYTEGVNMTGLPQGKTWRERQVSGGLGGVLPLPRYPGAQPNAADLLNYLSTTSANLAGKRQTTLDANAQAATYDTILGRNGGDVNNLSYGQMDDIASSTGADTRIGQVSDFFASAENAYAQSQYIQGILSKITSPIGNARTLGYQTGYDQGSAGFLGIRSPLDGAVLAGIGQHLSRVGFAFHNNVTPGQANTIYSNLYQQGWLGGQATNNMRTAAAQMMQFNPYIAQQPQYYSMMDESTRLGASSLEHFNDVMKQIPDASKAANVSIAQTMSAMDEMGQLTKQTGGTYIGGIQKATQFQNVTGLPATVLPQLMSSPFVQSQLYMGTGLMPWEQGLASGYQNMNSILSATNILGRSINTPASISSKDSIGLSSTVSGQDQKEALMAQYLGVDKATVHTILTNRAGWQAGINIGQSAQDYQTTVQNQLRGGHTKEAFDTLNGQPWDLLQHQLSTAVDSEGKRMFSKKQIAAIQNAGKNQGHWVTVPGGKGTGPYGQTHGAAQGGGPYGQWVGSKQLQSELTGGGTRKWVPDKNSAAETAAKRNNLIQKYMGQDSAQNGPSAQGPKLTIELGPAAKKVLHINDPNAQQKASQNAGAVSINTNSWATGPTFNPMPNLNYADGSGTYDYGSQYDTGDY